MDRRSDPLILLIPVGMPAMTAMAMVLLLLMTMVTLWISMMRLVVVVLSHPQNRGVAGSPRGCECDENALGVESGGKGLPHPSWQDHLVRNLKPSHFLLLRAC
jgi:hypothetical protein